MTTDPRLERLFTGPLGEQLRAEQAAERKATLARLNAEAAERVRARQTLEAQHTQAVSDYDSISSEIAPLAIRQRMALATAREKELDLQHEQRQEELHHAAALATMRKLDDDSLTECEAWMKSWWDRQRGVERTLGGRGMELLLRDLRLRVDEIRTSEPEPSAPIARLKAEAEPRLVALFEQAKAPPPDKTVKMPFAVAAAPMGPG